MGPQKLSPSRFLVVLWTNVWCRHKHDFQHRTAFLFLNLCLTFDLGDVFQKHRNHFNDSIASEALDLTAEEKYDVKKRLFDSVSNEKKRSKLFDGNFIKEMDLLLSLGL